MCHWRNNAKKQLVCTMAWLGGGVKRVKRYCRCQLAASSELCREPTKLNWPHMSWAEKEWWAASLTPQLLTTAAGRSLRYCRRYRPLLTPLMLFVFLVFWFICLLYSICRRPSEKWPLFLRLCVSASSATHTAITPGFNSIKRGSRKAMPWWLDKQNTIEIIPGAQWPRKKKTLRLFFSENSSMKHFTQFVCIFFLFFKGKTQQIKKLLFSTCLPFKALCAMT